MGKRHPGYIDFITKQGSWEEMHQNIIEWTHKKANEFGLRELSVLEIGSMDVNGTIRGCFTGPYVGIDFIDGPSVDVVMNAHDLQFPDNHFDVVACMEMLEHDSAFWITLAEVARVLKSGGHFLMTTRGNGFAEHGHPDDYWRFMRNSGPLIAELASCKVVTSEEDPYAPGVFVHGIRIER